MTKFNRELLIGAKETNPLVPVELCRPTDEQLGQTLKAAREARLEGATLRFQATDIAALVEELLEFRLKRVLLEKPE